MIADYRKKKRLAVEKPSALLKATEIDMMRVSTQFYKEPVRNRGGSNETDASRCNTRNIVQTSSTL